MPEASSNCHRGRERPRSSMVMAQIDLLEGWTLPVLLPEIWKRIIIPLSENAIGRKKSNENELRLRK